MNSTNKAIVKNFIEDIWNHNQFQKLDNYMAADFIDHSLPGSLPPNKEGMERWITATGKSFEHKTIIDDIVCEDDKVMLKIRMQMKHIGTWREIEPTYIDVASVGYRYYKLANGKIIEHWALIDGNTIENQLKKAAAD
jgi:predicted ester cyclase